MTLIILQSIVLIKTFKKMNEWINGRAIAESMDEWWKNALTGWWLKRMYGLLCTVYMYGVFVVECISLSLLTTNMYI